MVIHQRTLCYRPLCAKHENTPIAKAGTAKRTRSFWYEMIPESEGAPRCCIFSPAVANRISCFCYLTLKPIGDWTFSFSATLSPYLNKYLDKVFRNILQCLHSSNSNTGLQNYNPLLPKYIVYIKKIVMVILISHAFSCRRCNFQDAPFVCMLCTFISFPWMFLLGHFRLSCNPSWLHILHNHILWPYSYAFSITDHQSLYLTQSWNLPCYTCTI
jgi:hypothetical protein